MRTKVLNPKAKQKMLDAAQSLILTKGYKATSVEDICRDAKLTKGSFFHYFKSKDELAKTLLERFCCTSVKKMKESCCGDHPGADPLERVYAHVDFALERVRGTLADQGCLLGMLAQELSDTHPQIRSICANGFEGWAQLFKRDLEAAKAEYAPKANFSTASLAEHFIAIIEGSLILAKVKRDKKVIERNLLHFRAYLKGLFTK